MHEVLIGRVHILGGFSHRLFAENPWDRHENPPTESERKIADIRGEFKGRNLPTHVRRWVFRLQRQKNPLGGFFAISSRYRTREY